MESFQVKCPWCGELYELRDCRFHVKYCYKAPRPRGREYQQRLWPFKGDDSMAKVTGRTQDASAPILGAAEWQKGKRISGVVVKPFTTENGTCYQIKLDKPFKTSAGSEEQNVAIGALKGFEMALQACGLSELHSGDRIDLTCTGATKTNKGNPRIDFTLTVDTKD